MPISVCSVGWIIKLFGTDGPGVQIMSPYEFGDPLHFHIAP